MSIKRERALWLICSVVLIALAVMATNHMRDFNEYREQASEAQSTIGAVKAQNEELRAQIAKQEQTIQELKKIPLR